MRILLDTHVALWALTEDRRLAGDARKMIADPGNAVFVSTASVWEIAINRALGRSGIPFTAAAMCGYCLQAGYQMLVVQPAHAAAVETLPNLHADPYDRMLVAQALTEPMHLVTHDRLLAGYAATIMLV